MFYRKWRLYHEVYLSKIIRPLQVHRYLHQVRDRKKPLFIHINRTGGTSIAHGLGITAIHHTFSEYEKLYQRKFKEPIPLDIEVYASIRNPFDKVASEYKYRIKTNQNAMGSHPISFEAWVQKAYVDKDPEYRDRNIMFWPQLKWLEGSEAYTVKFLHFERLQKEYLELSEKFGGKDLPWKKKTDDTAYSSIYTEKAKNIVSKVFKSDLETFNYNYS
ncbi:hypothetical protein MG296_13690 [Flavobacteriaceae bacterium TK19130]|nr:hypothetical protein [Thermobacterium salinum]